MERHRGLLILATPLAGLLFLGALIAVRFADDSPPTAVDRRAVAPKAAPARAAVPPAPARLAAPSAVARSTDRARIYSIYQNYRTAIASGNATLERAVRGAALEHQTEIAALAEEELRRAPDELSRQVARKTLESLRK